MSQKQASIQLKVGEMNGIRTSVRTREKKDYVVKYEIVQHADGRKVFLVTNGMTGFESWRIEQHFLDDFDITKRPNAETFVMCMGDVGYNYPRYDRLEVRVEDMRIALQGITP